MTRATRQETLDSIAECVGALAATDPVDVDRYISLGYGDVPIMILETLESEYGTLPRRPVWLPDFEHVSDHFGWMREFREHLSHPTVQLELWAA